MRSWFYKLFERPAATYAQPRDFYDARGSVNCLNKLGIYKLLRHDDCYIITILYTFFGESLVSAT